MSNLTPIYFVRYARENTAIYMIQERRFIKCMEQDRGGFWVNEPASHTLSAAKALLAKLEAEGCVWAQAYHAGFKERGFRVGNRTVNPPAPKDAVEDSIEFGTYPEEARHFS